MRMDEVYQKQIAEMQEDIIELKDKLSKIESKMQETTITINGITVNGELSIDDLAKEIKKYTRVTR